LEKRIADGDTSLALSMLAARTYFALKDFAAGERTLRAAIDADPSNLQPYGMLGQLYVSQKKLDQALKEYSALASRQSKPVGALTMTGIIHQTRGDLSAAKKQYEAALAIDPNAAVAANNLAWLYAESGENLDIALQLAQSATAAAPDVPEVMDTLGWVHYRRNDFLRAIPFFERSVEKAPDNASYRYHLGLAYLKSGDESSGRAALKRALSASPDTATAAEIRRLLGEPSAPASGASPKG
jgi:tetratricopeptide (TPR) repeat protein